MRKGFIFKAARVVFVIAAAVAIAYTLLVMRPKAEREVRVKTGPMVEVFTVRGERMNMVIESFGTVKPREVLKLVSEVRGRVIDVHPSFKEGALARKGTPLIRIDPRVYQLEVDRRKAQITQIKAEIKRLKQEI